ncbi:universal stress protein [Streptomyces phytophilus]|uniref:universal stress protein n=1 Tax=Streptomyces phytophilus TaxID=722715 RepID=UPI00215DA7E5|nr:universal stress protein [Streptomyces phytophilus]
MRSKITYVVLSAVLVVYFFLAGTRGWYLLREGTPVTVAFGVAVLVLPAIGIWFLWHTTAFARAANALARELDAEAVAGAEKTYPGVRVERTAVEGSARELLIEASRDAGLLVTGARGRGGFTGLLLGSVSHALLQHAHCPVAVVRGAGGHT